MKWMSLENIPNAMIAITGPYQALVTPREDRGWQWMIARQPAGQAQQIVGQGLCDSCDAGKAAAETKIEEIRRPGRLPKAQKAMTGTERSRQRTARLRAKAVVADVMNQRLESLQGDLAAAGLSGWANRVAETRRIAALKAVAEYIRRNATFFVTTGPQMLSPEARSRQVQHITALAGKVDMLADAVVLGSVRYQQFEAILGELHEAGFYPENSLVLDVARAFH
ncbi:MAG: hypothetical protein HY521_01475 [Proteobacteria bacterium]|nr:hypothetical protein [Pseudomonadota bacterium]